ncbi:30S ribosomal protein S4 [Candidatus Marinamargulisbacteria bacterium SCGC AG-343-K17]|nr:30S ribosomal protein S4 [Candidatus Marinamargulisbacteria bacterium SCGC AG-343-K17]
MSGKSKVKVSKFKKQRRVGIELPGLGKPGALAKRSYPPGHHGQARRRPTEYSLRLTEKQKVLFHYNIREKQFRRFVKDAKKGHVVNWTDKLFSLLEMRLDNLVFRLGFARSLPAARQMIVHGHVLVEDRVLDRPSAIVSIGQVISFKEKFYKSVQYEILKENPTLPLPEFLERSEEKKGKEVGKLTQLPTLSDVPFELQSRFISELYANVK